MAGPWSKSSSMPLETYLDTVAPRSKENEDAAQSKSGDKDWDQNWEEGARAVILTILNNEPKLMDRELRTRSDFPSEIYDTVVNKLIGDELIQTTGEVYSLTVQGKEAARRERERLLG